MLLPAKTAGTFIADGNWQLIANGGSAVFESQGRIQWNLTTTSEIGPSEGQDGMNFEWHETEGLFRHSTELAEDEFLWLRGDNEDAVTGIVTNPVAQP